MAVRWTKTALANLIAIVEYIEKDNAERAKSFALEIHAKTNSLVEFPGLGRPGRVIGTRELIIHPNCIVPYRMRDGVVEILRVQHCSGPIKPDTPPGDNYLKRSQTRCQQREEDLKPVLNWK